MPYEATVYKVVIVGPSDTYKLKEIAKDVVNSIKNLIPESIVFLPTMWETDTYPETGDTAQNIINEQMIDEADILIGIFGNRIGTPTKTAISGTVEEIDRMLKAKKSCMIYFKNNKNDSSIVDKDQYEKLNEYKNSFYEKKDNKGLTRSYDTFTEFRESLKDHLLLKAKKIDKQLVIDPKKELKMLHTQYNRYIQRFEPEYVRNLSANTTHEERKEFLLTGKEYLTGLSTSFKANEYADHKFIGNLDKAIEDIGSIAANETCQAYNTQNSISLSGNLTPFNNLYDLTKVYIPYENLAEATWNLSTYNKEKRFVVVSPSDRPID